jgi:hypothetical protein
MSKSFTTLADADQKWYSLMRRNSEIPQKTRCLQIKKK